MGIGGNTSDTVLLVHCDGADTSTTFTDDSLGGSTHTVTANGAAQVDTGITDAFGGTDGALMLGGIAADYLSITQHADMDFGTDDFGIDMWVRPSDTSVTGKLISTGKTLGYLAYIFFSGSPLIGLINNGSTIGGSPGSGITDDTWSHVLFEMDDGNIRIYVDGDHKLSSAYSTDIDASTDMWIGEGTITSAPFGGHMQEIRIVKGVCPTTDSTDPLYISSGTPADGFTPPTEQYSEVVIPDMVRSNRMPKTTRDDRFFVPARYSIPHVEDPVADGLTITRQDDGTWLFEWTAGAAPWRIFLDGKLIDTVTSASYTYPPSEYRDTPPPLEIVSAGEDAESEIYPAWATLQWREATSAFQYIAQQYIDSVWVDINTQPETGAGTYTYETPSLTDATASQWRVLAIDSSGREGTPLAFTFKVNRNPPEPDVDYACSGGTLTISAG